MISNMAKSKEQIHYETVKLYRKQGRTIPEIARVVSRSERTVIRWLKRKSELAPKLGPKRKYSVEEIKAFVRAIRYAKGSTETGGGHCTGKELAQEIGCSTNYACYLLRTHC